MLLVLCFHDKYIETGLFDLIMVDLEFVLSRIRKVQVQEAESNQEARLDLVERGVYRSVYIILTEEHKTEFENLCSEKEMEAQENVLSKENEDVNNASQEP